MTKKFSSALHWKDNYQDFRKLFSEKYNNLLESLKMTRISKLLLVYSTRQEHPSSRFFLYQEKFFEWPEKLTFWLSDIEGNVCGAF